jgi:hypothetical protein
MIRSTLLFLPLVLAAAEPGVFDEMFQGRDAWVMRNGRMQVSILKGGGFFGEIRLTSGDAKRDLNPMRVPHYPTIDPHTYDDAKHNAIYGDGPHRWLHSGYMGNYLCFPIFGPPSSEAEGRAGLGNHGETVLVPWRQVSKAIQGRAIVLDMEADLKVTRYKIRRRVTMPIDGAEFTVEETVENLLPMDRPFQWMQHATFGPPFIAPGKSVMRISAVRSGTEGEPLAERTMPATPHSGSYTALLLDMSRKDNFFVMSNPDHPTSIGFVFSTAEHPWVGDWQENQRNTGLPWQGKTIARGIEFGNSPYAEGLRKAIERGRLFDVPTYGWIEANGKYQASYTVFLTDTAAGDIQDVRLDGTRVIVTAK